MNEVRLHKPKMPARAFSGAPGVPEEYIGTALERHDRLQFEAKMDYKLQPNSKQDEYLVSAYLFIPRSLQIDAQTYPHDRFIADMTTRMRFKTPVMSIRSLTREDNKASPLIRVKHAIAGVEGQPDSAHIIEIVTYELKLLACIVKSSLRDQVLFYMSALEEKHLNPDVFENVRTYADDIVSFLDSFRELSHNLFSAQVPETLRETYRFVDEYISLNVSKRVTVLAKMIHKMSGTEELFDALRDIIESEQAHRKANDSFLLLKKDSDNERFTYWEGIYKKYVQAVLYLDQRKSEEKAKMTQILYAIAAGIAMTFWVLVAVFLLYGASLNPTVLNSLGSYTAAWVLVGVVVTYMLKDAIKRILQIISDKALRMYFPDRQGRIFDPEGHVQIGSWKETAQYVPFDEVPSEILNLRQASNRSPIEQEGKPEIVLRYNKSVTLNPIIIRQKHERRNDINDILRFNIHNFLTYADDPFRIEAAWIPEEQAFRQIKSGKVYHINIIFKLEYTDDTGTDRVQYKKVRLVIDQTGIKRIVSIA